MIPIPSEPCPVPPGFDVDLGPSDEDTLLYYDGPQAWVFRHEERLFVSWSLAGDGGQGEPRGPPYWTEYLVVETDQAQLDALLGNRLPCRDFLLSHPEGVLVFSQTRPEVPLTARRIRTADLADAYLPVAGTLLGLEGP